MKRNISKEEMNEILVRSKSLKQVIINCGLSPNGSMAYQNIKNKIKKLGLEIPIYKYYGDPNVNKRYTNEQVFVENSSYSRDKIKSRIIKYNLLPYECEKCKNHGEWNGQKLSLHLDHKNGINNDNRLENLRFLCPNCHSQTATYAGKNIKLKNITPKIKKHYSPSKDKCACGEVKQKRSKTCVDCRKKMQKKNMS